MTPPSERCASFKIASGDRIAIVAGSGLLPTSVIEELVRSGHRPLVVSIEGEAEFSEDSSRYDFLQVPAEALGKLPPLLKRRGVTHLVLAGGVSRRPPIRKLHFSPRVLLYLPRLLAGYALGDDGLLRAMVAFVQSYGIQVVGAHEIAPDVLAPEGLLTKARPTRPDERDIAAALDAARMLGRLDIGQGAIAVGGRTVALEDIDGTDGLLARMKVLRTHGRLAGKKRGVLLKCAKPGQELRTDLPTIGPRTVSDAYEAGLAGIAVEAGRSFILDRAETVRRADEHGLFILGFPQGRGM
ncbi:UDP-2,3-diacylglucosamine diphosphatase LpxI [Chelativorans sp. Marseille-P2723]|uniref:LpxI family protein n=1 Tax=Chelativorans sp. Marseille-P2723 TaxID=2709133 RepID=UPI00156F5C4E|nr:UDP-2,3-diacylglucosamine diphosphatase LpxI [Chelativorans sp. Marseille-P2723]